MKLDKLFRELRAAYARHKYDVRDDGELQFVGAKLRAGGVFEHCLNHGPWHADHNMMPKQGRNALVDIALGSGAKQSAWYMAPFATNTAPTQNLTAANFAATQVEFTNYTAPNRTLWTPAAAVDGVTSNSGTPVSIFIGPSAQVNMYGLALISAQAKSATTGVLAACALFMKSDGVTPKPRLDLVEGDELGLRYTVSITSV